jgi:DNA-directed RNA polymerase specialized sigma24 family protein
MSAVLGAAFAVLLMISVHTSKGLPFLLLSVSQMNSQGDALLTNAMSNEHRMKAVISRHVRGHDVQDVLQDVYLSLLSADAQHVDNLLSYSLRVADHVARAHARRRRSARAVASELGRLDLPLFDRSPEDIVMVLQGIAAGFADIPATARAAIVLQSAGHTVPEIARELGCPVFKVKDDLCYFHGIRAKRRKQSQVHDQDSLPSRTLTGTIYEASAEIALPPGKIITEIAPRIEIVSAALAERLQRHPERVHELTPRQFECLVAELLTDMSYGHVELTPMTRDGGRDLLAYVDLQFGTLLCIVEVKKHRSDRPVGIGLVRSLYGTLCDEDASYGMLVTTSYFTPEAHKLQAKHPRRLSLRDYTHLVDWIRAYRRPRH